MALPFPGIDPYLEQAAFWSSFHSRLIVAIADALEPELNSQYYIEIETRTYQSNDAEPGLLVGISSTVETQTRPKHVTGSIPLTVNERYLEIRETRTEAVVTVIEVLSPKNKRRGEGREAYERKRRTILGSATHLVELDLLRGGKPMTILDAQVAAPYRILISRSEQRPKADLYEVMLQQPLPTVPVPLKAGDREPILPLQQIVVGVYERGRYASRIDYHQPVPPPELSPTEQAWAMSVLSGYLDARRNADG
ncbi:MAG: DUF4058 family protein [Cyanobacteria bacterium J069]|nr:MAG: DUF4058 family protein [Cyanobacteria bacterium J069]